MSATFTINEKTGEAYTRIPRSFEEASTFHVNRIRVDKTATMAEPDSIAQAFIRAYHALVPKRIIEEEQAEEREWESIVSKPHVRQALRRIAAEARQQYYAGETEEGGFAVE